MSDFNDIVFQEYEKRHLKKEFVAGVSFIPPSGPVVSKEDIATVVDTVLDGWFTEWKQSSLFEKELESLSDKKYASLVNSGSSANLVAVSTVCEDNPAPYFITCASGFPTTIAPIYQNHRVPIFVDIDPYTLVFNYEQYLDALEYYKNQIAGAIFIHNLGFAYDEKFVKESMPEDVSLIADGCDALGSAFWVQLGDTVQQIKIGTYADFLTYSFFPAHVITTGEGGAVLTNDWFLHETAQSFINWGRSCRCLPGQSNICGERFSWKHLADLPIGFDHKYVFDRIGYNLKMTEIQASLGNAQIKHVDDFIQTRRNNYTYLYNGLKNLWLYHGVHLYDLHQGTNPFGFPMMLPPEVDTNEFIDYLETHKVGTRRLFAGNIIRQPGYYNQPKIVMGSLSGSDQVMDKVLWIGCHPGIDYNKIDYMIETIQSYFKTRKT